MAFGPIQIFAFGFPDTAGFEGRIADELIKLSDAGVIRIVDALAVVADGDEVEILRVSDLDEAQREELGMEMGALVGLGMAGLEGMVEGAAAGAEIVQEGGLGVVEAIGEDFIDNLPDGSAALLLIIEGLLPMVAPQAWQKAMQELSRHNPKAIRIGGIVSMLAGAILLQFIH